MGLFQLANTNTFGQLVTAIAGLLGISNYLTDGPSLVANTELILTKPGTTLNVATDMTIGDSITVGNTHTSSLSRTINTPIISLTSQQATLTNVNIHSGFLQSIHSASMDSLNVTTLAISSNTIFTQNSSITVATLVANSVNILSGSMILKFNPSFIDNGIIHSLQSNSLTGTISTTNISNVALIGCSLTTPIGLHKANVGLSNVDNTSDVTKNSAMANLSNKSLMSPLIISGNVSSHPTSRFHISSELYANTPRHIHNPIINGNMDIWQRGNTVSVINGENTFLADRFNFLYLHGAETANITLSRSNNVPTFANSGITFTNSLQVNTTNAMMNVAEFDYAAITHPIEGYYWKDYSQRNLVLSFWISATKPGIYSTYLRNVGLDQSYISEYTISAANTWQYISIPISPSPSTGTWDYTTDVGLSISWVLVSGSGWMVNTHNTWQGATGTFQCSSNQVNSLDTTYNLINLTGVQLETGNVASDSIPTSYQEELNRCKRYYQKSFYVDAPPSSNIGVSTGEYRFVAFKAGNVQISSPTIILPIPMRNTGSKITERFNPSNTNFEVRDISHNVDCSNTHIHSISNNSIFITANGHSTTGIGDTLAVHWTIDTEL